MFQAVCDSIRAEYEQLGSDGKVLSDRIIRGLELTHDSPPVAEFEAVLRKAFTPEEVRVAIFHPQEEQICYYPLLLLAAEAAAAAAAAATAFAAFAAAAAAAGCCCCCRP